MKSHWRLGILASLLAVLLVAAATGVGVLRYRVPVSEPLVHQGGALWVCNISYPWPPFFFLFYTRTDSEVSPYASRLKLFDSIGELGPSHAQHVDIQSAGGGRYSHWNHQIYFSTRNGDDPRFSTVGPIEAEVVFSVARRWALVALAGLIAIAWLLRAQLALAGTNAKAWSLRAHRFLERFPTRRIVMITGICALSYLAVALYLYSLEPARVVAGGFGTARAPYSDALGPWLQGGLHALFGLQQLDQLYRPTVGLFWGSVIAVTGRVYFIPLVFLGLWFALVLNFLIRWRSSSLGIALTLWLLWLTISFDTSLVSLSPLSLTLDFAAFVLTVSGTFLIVAGARERTLSMLPCLVGGFALGVAAAIRGPMMAGGLVFILCMLLPHGKIALRVAAATLLCFLVPIIGDALLQRHYHVISNGLVSLFCVYSDPSHTWGGACHSRYLQLHVSATDIVLNYLRFLASLAGVSFLLDGFERTLRRDLSPFLTGSWATVLVTFSAYTAWRLLRTLSNSFPDAHGNKTTLLLQIYGIPLWFLFLFWSFFFTARQFPSLTGVFAGALLFVCSMSALKLKRWVPLSLLLAYLAACSFLVFIGLWAYDRLATTFSFLVILGILLLVFQPAEQTHQPRRSGLHALSLALVVLFGGLYTCWAWWPSELRTIYLAKVEGQNAAIKISDDKLLDRSLYFTGEHYIVYTRSDNMETGSVRRNTAFKYPDRFWIGSFIEPNAFLD